MGRIAPRIQHPVTQDHCIDPGNSFLRIERTTQRRSLWLLLFFLCIINSFPLLHQNSNVINPLDLDTQEIRFEIRYVESDSISQGQGSDRSNCNTVIGLHRNDWGESQHQSGKAPYNRNPTVCDTGRLLRNSTLGEQTCSPHRDKRDSETSYIESQKRSRGSNNPRRVQQGSIPSVHRSRPQICERIGAASEGSKPRRKKIPEAEIGENSTPNKRNFGTRSKKQNREKWLQDCDGSRAKTDINCLRQNNQCRSGNNVNKHQCRSGAEVGGRSNRGNSNRRRKQPKVCAKKEVGGNTKKRVPGECKETGVRNSNATTSEDRRDLHDSKRGEDKDPDPTSQRSRNSKLHRSKVRPPELHRKQNKKGRHRSYRRDIDLRKRHQNYRRRHQNRRSSREPCSRRAVRHRSCGHPRDKPHRREQGSRSHKRRR